MNTLTAWKFHDPGGAEEALERVQALIAKVRKRVTPGTSALFLLSHGAVVDRVATEMADFDMELLRSNLDPDQERRLRAALVH